MKPFLSGRKTLETQPLRIAHHHALAGAQGATPPVPNGANVEVVKQGDKVTRLIITCSCGERIEVDCLYPAGS